MTDLNRRKLLLTGAGAAAMGLTGAVSFLPSTAYAQVREKGYYSYKVGGDIEVFSIYDGIWERPLSEGFVQGASVSEVENALKKGGFSGSFIPLEFAFTVVKSAGKTIMIDAGTGAQLVDTAGKAAIGLQNAGISLLDVDTVLVSHMHPDHVWGLIEKDTNAQVFPNAEIMIGEREYDFWTDETNNASLPEGRRGAAARIQAVFPAMTNVTRFAEHAKDLAPGISSIPAPGHTLGHTVFIVSSGDEQLMVLGDMVLTPALFVKHPEWQVAVDMDKEAAKKTRFELMDRAVADGAIVAGYHFGFPNSGKIAKDGKGYVFEPTAG